MSERSEPARFAASKTAVSTIELRAVSKRFGQLAALDDIDLGVASGEFVTLLGPSGCGKTTLLRIVAGLERPSAGEVRVDGEAPEVARRGKRIGFVPQAPALLPWRTVRKNATLLRQVNRRVRVPDAAPDPIELLEEVGLGGFLDALPHELSGGMQQRVALVRAFALGAPLLLMDEPFAALDEITRADMRHLLGRLCERTGAAVVFVTHSIAEAVFLSDRVVVMTPRPGRIAGAVEVDLPRPRLAEVEDRPEFFRHETALRALLHAGAAAR
jgi:NitT/TauT family transport system ATP-binding protein